LKTYLTASLAFTPLTTISNPVLVVEDGRIERFGDREEIAIPAGARHTDFADHIFVPGMIDIHIHGGAGHDVMEGEESVLQTIETHLAQHGVTAYLPTTVTAAVETTLRALERLGKAVRRQEKKTGRARPIGVHLEGPFISKAKCGVHPSEHIQPPSIELFRKMMEAADGSIRLMTVAPELPGAEGLIGAARAVGVRVSLGHSNAYATAARSAIAAGATHATHTFNAMRPMDHREPGIVGVVLSEHGLTADIIADGVHVSPEMVKLFLAAKGAEGAVLITDAISATGMGDGTFRLGTFSVEVKGNRCSSNDRLAGSVLTMDRAVRNIMSFADWTLQETLRLATANPAGVVGVDGQKGFLAAGMDADVVVLTRKGDVIETLVSDAN
jgi:N-acetylglucosamine-6-phosphate deacetylase